MADRQGRDAIIGTSSIFEFIFPERAGLKQATLQFSWIVILLIAIATTGCGNNQATFNQGSGNQPLKPVTRLDHRVLVTNYYAGMLDVVDAVKIQLTPFTFAVGSAPTTMLSSPDKTLTLVNNSGSNSLSTFDNRTEAVKATIPLGGWTQSFVATTDNKRGYAAVYNYSNGTTNPSGAIVPFNPTDGSVSAAIPFPHVLHLAMDPGEEHLLAFTDTDNDAHWVDLQATDPATQGAPYYTLALTDAAANPVTLSRPVAAFFSTDGTKAYVLSCGAECGGSGTASVTEIDTTSITTPVSMTTGTVIGAKVIQQWVPDPIDNWGARVGMLDATTNQLYVAGSTQLITDSGSNTVQDGWLTVINLSTGAAAAPIRIGNGVKLSIHSINGVLWVGSKNCGVQSCLTMVQPNLLTAQVLATAHGDATGITLASIHGDDTDDVYTIEGGELYVYDQTGAPVNSTYNTDIVGQASDVLYIN
jgi:YVTN family beta-propeller protein